MIPGVVGRRSSRRSRSRTAKALESEEQRSETPRNRSSVNSSRASSPGRGVGKKKKKKKKRSGKTSKSSKANKSSTTGSSSSSRGYNPDLVNYKDSEYHYGSDFEDYSDPFEDENEKDGDLEEDSRLSEESILSSLSSDELRLSDVDLGPEESLPLVPGDLPPLPYWLRKGDEEDQEIPTLRLPDSSHDLPLPSHLLLEVSSIYEVLKHYRLILRLSPFRVEDFCYALSSEEQSNLLSEVHISLLKSLLRADDKDGTVFGPMDQKDSINCFFYFLDSVTWPETLRAYLSSSDSPDYREALSLIKSNEYPVGDNFLDLRVKMLRILCDQFLTTAAVRDFIATEGAPVLEDHCRVCHRLGDMVVCDVCGGTYHLTCLDPPLADVPDEEEWTCQICISNETEGVSDCTSREEDTTRIRHETLGYDREGNKYWFFCRRLFIEHNAKEGEDKPRVSYFSSVKQFHEVKYALDREVYEADLYASLENMHSEIERQMVITEELSREKKNGPRKSYLDLENEAIEKIQYQRKLEETRRLEEKQRIQANADQIREKEDLRNKQEENDRKQEEEDKKRKEREARLKRREESRGDAFPLESPEKYAEIKDEILDVKDEKLKSEEVINTVESDKERGPLKEEQTEVLKLETKSENEKPRVEAIPPSIPTKEETDVLLAGELRMTRRTTQQLSSGTLYYKLGQEGSFRNYVNQYTTNTFALSKVQANEERDKKRFMSHKFSLTDASAFKWHGSLHGNRKLLVSTVRQTLIHLENTIPSMFMHVNWNLLRKPWIGAVSQSVTPRDFSRALTVLQCCMRPCIMLNVWTEQLGYTQLKRITSQMREERKKLEKREKRENEERDERLRPFMSFVKYTLGLKHQVSKQKGEEYRAHGQYGWLWLSVTRNFKPTDARSVGLRAGPHRLAVKYTDTRDNTSKVVLMEPRAFEYLLKRQKEMETKKKSDSSEDEDKKPVENSKIALEKKKLEDALRNARLDRQIPPDDSLNDVVDVEHGLSNPTRVLYPKVAKKARVLDDFLTRRIQLKTYEEQCIASKKKLQSSSSVPQEVKDEINVEGEKDAKPTMDDSKNNLLAQIKKDIWVTVTKLKDDAKIIFQRKCYSSSCRLNKTLTPFYSCYSKVCPSKRPALTEAKTFYIDVIEKVTKECSLKIPPNLTKEFFTSHEVALEAFMNLLKVLIQKNVSNDASLQVSKPTINGEIKSQSESSEPKVDIAKPEEEEENGLIYSSKNTSGKLYLKRIKNVSADKKSSKVVKYPLAPYFYSKSRKTRSILILSRHDVKRLSRKCGTVSAEGFNYSAKSNNQVWPYPCPRPTFRTTWLFRTASVASIHSVAIQMRILWGCIRWDDMIAKPLSSEGKHQVTTDTSIVTTEILKHRCTGRYSENTEFLLRKVTIPLDVPKTVVEVTPIRSGLRKRKRAESPQQSEPKVVEEWTDETNLELWEIRAYREKLEREKTATITRSRTGTTIREPVKYDPGSSADYSKKEKLKSDDNQSSSPQNVKIHREVILQSGGNKKLLGTSITSRTNSTPTIIRRVTNPDGTISLVKSTPTVKSSDSSTLQSTPTTTSQNRSVIGPSTKKVFISKDGKIIGAQVLPGQSGKSPVTSTTLSSVQPKASTPTQQQKVQIVRSSDGKIQVKGLLPGQQLVQMPDGKLQIFSQPNNSTSSGPVTSHSSSLSTATSPLTGSKTIQLANKTATSVTPSISSPNKQIVAQQLPPGSQIPPGMAVFMSNGKTYCIPKASTLAAQQQQQQQPNVKKTPALQITPSSTVVNKPHAADIVPQSQTPQTQKTQMVNVMSLGSNTVTFRGNQMIVSGPDQAHAQLIAKQLSSGAARLGTIGGKQVLIMTSSQQVQQSPTNNSSGVSTSPNIATILPQTPVSPSQIQPESNTGSILANTLTSPMKPEVPSNVQLPTEPLPPSPSIQTSPQVTQPSSQVTAQLIQTPQGPRIILQGIQGANLPKEQLVSIQQQVKAQLLKAQAEAKLQNRVPPTKIAVVLPPAIQAKIDQQHQLKQIEERKKEDQCNKTIIEPTTYVNSNLISTSKPSVIHQQPLPQKVIQQTQRPASIQQTSTGQRMLVVTQPGQKIVGVANANVSEKSTELPPQTILGQSVKEGEKFELTQDYIQKTIQQALTTQDLAPEIQQKLMALQHGSESTIEEKPTSAPIDPATGEPMDDEWQPTPWQQKQATKIAATTQEQQSETIEPPNQPSPILPPQSLSKPVLPSVTPARQKNVSSVSKRADEKKRQHIQNKISSMLFRHKEQLKKDIAKKRALQEKELQYVIQRDIERIKATLAAAAKKESGGGKRKRDEDRGSSSSPSRKKKKSGGSSSAAPAAAIQAGIIKKDKVYCVCKTKYDATKFYVGCDTCNNWFHGSCVGITEEMSKSMTEYFCDECKSAKDNQEIYCLCRQPYDDLQFYIGCERCADWFHGRCVGILQVEADNIDEYICPRCDANTSYNFANLKPLNNSDYELVKKLVKQLLANRNSWPFKEPVDPNDVPNYYTVVKEPMDLQTIDLRVNQSQYERLSDFVGDVMRIFENCRYFNQPNSQVMKCAESLENYFAQKLSLVRDKVSASS